MKHPSGIHQTIVDKVVARRGRLHAYEHINPASTALIVIDMDVGTVRRMIQESGTANVLRAINALSTAVRSSGGAVAWVTTPVKQYDENFRAIFGDTTTRQYESEAASGDAAQVASELEVKSGDLHATKSGYSAFFPGKSNVHELLKERNIDTVLIVGTVTNVCCESAARDAYELGYKVIMVSDALKGHGHGLHEGSLAVVFRNFGDVRLHKDVIKLLAQS